MTDFDLKVTDKLLSTTRSVRKRLDFEREVPTEVVMECLELGLQAPTGSNRQGWRWREKAGPRKTSGSSIPPSILPRISSAPPCM